MLTNKNIFKFLFTVVTALVTANGQNVCDSYTNLGSNSPLDNKPWDNLNTNEDVETAADTFSRLKGLMPIDDPFNFQPDYDPVSDAYCFNEHYPVPSLSSSQQTTLYYDYAQAFNKINEFTNDVSEENNRVTNNRIPGMFLRMCFHDNSIDPTQPEFQQYVASAIDPLTLKWIAESRYMKTSGADASVLICPEERYHPNQNYDQTASRVLKSIQTILKKKYPQMSYSDLLHNGCNAATIYLTQQTNPATALAANPFTFGRKDACHADKKCVKKYPLCGPTELLPGVDLSASAVNNWFTSRGMSECLFMGLMWTHTTVDNMASMCPITRLTCTASTWDVLAFADRDKLYFNAGDNLDYFNFFLKRGTHQTLPDTGDDTDPSCNWSVDGRQVPWPMTGIDCTLGLSNVERNGLTNLANAIKNFGHNAATYNRVDILQCALKILGGTGGAEGGACNRVIPSECKSNPNHKFGGFYGTLPVSNIRSPVKAPTKAPTCSGNIQGIRIWNVANKEKKMLTALVTPGGTTSFCASTFVNIEAITDPCVKDVDFKMTGPSNFLLNHHEFYAPYVLLGEINEREVNGRYLSYGTYSVTTTPGYNYAKNTVYKVVVMYC